MKEVTSTRPTERPIVIGLAALFFFPVGLYLVWKHPTWSVNKKRILTGTLAVLLLGAIGSASDDKTKNESRKTEGIQPGLLATAAPPTSVKNNSSDRYASSSEWKRLAEVLVKDVKVGMSAEQVRSLMGDPHDVNEHHVAGKQIVIWTWKKQEDPQNSFIHLDVSGGVVTGGGSTGYDIRTGFKTKLPYGGTAEERATLKTTLERLGVQVEE
jgi:hypothetical protein